MGDQERHVVVIGDALVVPVSVVHTAGLGVYEDELCVVLVKEGKNTSEEQMITKEELEV